MSLTRLVSFLFDPLLTSTSHIRTMSDNSDPLGIPVDNTIFWEYFDPGTTTSSTLLNTEDPNWPYVEPDAAALFPHDFLRLSSKTLDEPISHEEPIYETSWTLPSRPQIQDLEKVIVDARFDDQVSDVSYLSYGIDNSLGTTFQCHFAPGNDRRPDTQLDSYSLNTMDLSPKYHINSRTGFDGNFLHNPDGILGNNRPSTTGFDDPSFSVLRPMPGNDRPLRYIGP